MLRRLRLPRFAAALILVATLVPATAVGAQDANGLEWSADATYVIEADEGRVLVDFAYRFVNQADGVAFPGFFESLPEAAVDVEAVEGGRELAVAATGIADGTATWFVPFVEPLEPGAETEVRLTWTIEHEGLPGPMVVPGAVQFDGFRPGPTNETAGGVVRVVAPAGYDSVDGHTPVRGADDSAPTYEAFVPAYELTRFRFVAHELFVGDLLELPPVVAITSWPGDDAWVRSVGDRAAAVVDELDTWFGTVADGFAIRRALPGDDHASVAGDLVELVGADATSVDHQLAHVWLADVTVDEPWFIEGLALGFAGERAVTASPEAMMAQFVDELGAAGVRAVVDALRAETTPYPGVIAEPRHLPPGWQTLLDLIERVGGVDDAASGFRALVTDDAGDQLIDRRAAAVADYTALETRAGSWAMPPFLRNAMATWDFDTFFDRQAEVSDVIVTRDSLAAWADSLELGSRTDAQEIFEAAEVDMSEVVERLAAQEAALEAFDEAEAAVNGDRGLLAAVGLWGSDPDGDLVDVRERWAAGEDDAVVHDAHELTDAIEGAVGRGTVRLMIPALSIIGVWQVIRWLRRRATARGAVVESDEPGAADDAQSANVSA